MTHQQLLDEITALRTEVEGLRAVTVRVADILAGWAADDKKAADLILAFQEDQRAQWAADEGRRRRERESYQWEVDKIRRKPEPAPRRAWWAW